jgi:hypothetical protein
MATAPGQLNDFHALQRFVAGKLARDAENAVAWQRPGDATK